MFCFVFCFVSFFRFVCLSCFVFLSCVCPRNMRAYSLRTKARNHPDDALVLGFNNSSTCRLRSGSGEPAPVAGRATITRWAECSPPPPGRGVKCPQRRRGVSLTLRPLYAGPSTRPSRSVSGRFLPVFFDPSNRWCFGEFHRRCFCLFLFIKCRNCRLNRTRRLPRRLPACETRSISWFRPRHGRPFGV